MINKVVYGINVNIRQSFGKYDVLLAGISEPAVVTDHIEEIQYPAVFDNNGEGKYVFMDDNYSFGCYHKLINKSYSQMKGFGDSDIDVEIAELDLICWGFRNKLHMCPEQVQSKIIIPCIPMEAKLINSLFDKQKIFHNEFKNIPYNVNPEEFIFSVKYKVQYPFKRGCVEKKCKR